MAHYIHGFIAHLEPLCEAAAVCEGMVVAPLALGFGFLPITEDLAGPDGPWAFENLRRLTVGLVDWAAEQSRTFPLAYIETNYFGVGNQAAVVWRDGAVVFVPELCESKWVDENFLSPPYLDKAINRSLRLLGVNRGAVVDEFDAVGLGQHRFDEGWVAEAARHT